MAAVVRSRFYPIIAIALAILIVAGFSRTYYLRFLFDQPPLTILIHLHALVFTAWMLLFIVQTRFIAANNLRAHKKLGVAGAVLAAFVFLLGVISPFATLYPPVPRPAGLNMLQFLALPLSGIFLFGSFVIAGLAYRRKSAFHKRFMLLAMISVLGPPVARLIRFFEFGENFVLIQTLVAAFFVACALIYDAVKHRVLHPVFAYGGTFLVLSWPLRFYVARSEGWQAAMAWLTS